MYEIPNFSLYFLNEYDEVVRKSDGKIMPLYLRGGRESQRFFKLKNDTGSFTQISNNTLFALAKGVSPPEGYDQVPKYPKLYVSKEGKVWSSPTPKFPLGNYLMLVTSSRYPQVRCGAYGTLEVHMLLALTYLDSKYLDKGLCVMHIDDDKSNFSLSNLKVASYSENNKAAYDTGVNPSKKQ